MISFSLAKKINSRINESTKYRSDIDLYKKLEHWEIAKNEGDCEDYALAKRSALLESEAEPEFISIALCWTETNEYHAVLIVKTDKGEYVLDNRYPYPMSKDMLRYRWHKIQKGAKWYLLS